MIADKNRIYDGWIQLEQGVDAGRGPTLVDPNQAVSAENVTFRGGFPSVRPGFRQLTEIFTNPDHGFDNNGVELPGRIPNTPTDPNFANRADQVYRNGVFQCAIGYSPHRGDDAIVALIGGRLFKIVPSVNTCQVTEITVTDAFSPYPNQAAYCNRGDLPIAYMIQADKWLIAQDGNFKAIIYDGKTARRSHLEDSSNPEIPTGTMMDYGSGRLVVIVNDRDVAFGDLYGSHLDVQTDPADSIIQFTERTFLAGGFDAAIPFGQGVVTGIKFFPQLDTSTGNGQVLVFAERGAAAFNTVLDRSLWSTSAFQILALLTTGCRGSRSIAVVNEDLWFRSSDGYRAFRQARSDAWGWAHLPLSTNVGQFLDIDDGELLKFASSIYFDNRIIGTTSPVWNSCGPVPGDANLPNNPFGRVYHNGMVVVDFDILSSFGSKYKPTWEGHWTIGNVFTASLPNIKISQLLTAAFNETTRGFVFGQVTQQVPDTGDVLGGYHVGYTNQLYELSLGDNDDFQGQIPWDLVSRAYDFRSGGGEGGGQSNPFTENELYDGDIWVTDVASGGISAGVAPVIPPG